MYPNHTRADSTENKSNIANFFGNAKQAAKGKGEQKMVQKTEADLTERGIKVEHDVGETRATTTTYQQDGSEENNAPLPVPGSGESQRGAKREYEDEKRGTAEGPPEQKLKVTPSQSPKKSPPKVAKTTRGARSATSNGTAAKASPKKKAGDGSQKITAFFGK